MSGPTYAPSAGNMTAGARRWTATPKSAAVASGMRRATTVNGAIDSGSGIDAERDLDHRLVAGDDDLVHLGRIDVRLGAHLVGELLERLVRVPLEPLERVVVHHDRRDPRDHVRAERLLRVQDRPHRLRLSGLEVDERRDDGRRAEVEGDRVAAASTCRPPPRRSARRRRGPRSPSSSRGAACRRARARCRAGRAARRRPSPRARARDPTSGPRASARRARRSASARPGRRITWRPTPTSAAFGRVCSGGTSTVRSSCVFARHASRQPLFSSSTVNARGSTGLIGACPETTLTLHFLHVPWPPHVESIAMPFQLAASKIVVPASTRASLTAWSSPDWRKRRRTRSGCGSSGMSSSAFTPSPRPASRGTCGSRWRPTRRGRAGSRSRGRPRPSPAGASP